jgi:predicted negative regulator of RcsB-dependent stress response
MKSTDEFETFLATFVEELIAMPDEQVLEGRNPEEVRARGLGLLEAARKDVGRRRMAAAKAQLQARRGQPAAKAIEQVDIALARQFLAQAQNDPRFTLAARKLGELSDDEALNLYRQVKALQEGEEK